ncbi:hypothetical protein Amsp01_043400 [Amycolatopsis sp. NBRC 101858]|uniref:HSP18 transcriptional regulator n=1 Tax=Amycolatopsis sp. NBRC 101858 TaxID=3032200 RepID=UPI0024A06A76|nr:HSP18 transcriptional regulator [Amycolatopsis sp. NBRC 101858]GLY38316.1 hypothetical protein Amsp01_043400 [Amycolatopsis sp. NBRC 101858]
MANDDPIQMVRDVHEVVVEAQSGGVAPDRLLSALVALRSAREQLAGWEPELIAAARAGGSSWASLAPALGVASRQAAERRFLRLRPSLSGEATGEGRVDAERDRRAGDRAVADWARRNSAVVRQLAGQVSALGDLDEVAREDADRVGAALGDDDVTRLLSPLAAIRAHLASGHAALADRLGAVGADADRVRQEAAAHRRNQV